MQREPHPKAPGVAAGISEEMIRDLVHRFYAEVRRDPLLGPIFNARVKDWDEHLDKLCAFWSSVVLMTGRYKGRPMPVHAAIAEISPAHFARWLGLFEATARMLCPEPAAAVFVDRSRRIAESLEIGIALHRGADPGFAPSAHGAPQSSPADR
jgi:hemoglobin